jgi:hypothetical protein
MFSVTPSNDPSSSTTILGIPLGIIQYIIGTLSLLSAILTGVIRQLKPGEMYQQHASIAKRYHNLIRSIDACLSLTSSLRPNPVIFIERAGVELDNLANTQLEPPLIVIRRFEAIYGPLERVLYGEDVIELWKITYETNKLEKKMRKRMITTELTTRGDSLNFNINERLDDQSHVKINMFPPNVDKSDYQQQESLDGLGGFLLNKFTGPFKTSVRVPGQPRVSDSGANQVKPSNTSV